MQPIVFTTKEPNQAASVRLPHEMWERLQKIAARQKTSRNAALTTLLGWALDAYEERGGRK